MPGLRRAGWARGVRALWLTGASARTANPTSPPKSKKAPQPATPFETGMPMPQEAGFGFWVGAFLAPGFRGSS